MLKLGGSLLKVEGASMTCVQALKKAAQPKKQSTKVWKERYVRYRKPPWAPLAVTKLHRVSQGADWEGPEYEEMKTRYFNYRTIKKSLYHYLKLEVDKKDLLQAQQEAEELKVGGDGSRMKEVNEINDAWNKSIQEKRSALDEEELSRVEKELEEVMQELTKSSEHQELEAQTTIIQAMEQRKNFITDASSLDEAIETSLNKMNNHNFCIDLDGNKYYEQSDGTIQGLPPSAGGGGWTDGEGGVRKDGGRKDGGRRGGERSGDGEGEAIEGGGSDEKGERVAA